MYKTLTVFLLLAFTACKQKNQPPASIAKTDTIIPVMDTANVPYTIPDWVHDTLGWRHTLDSFYAIKPIISYSHDTIVNKYDKLVADVIDTTGVVTTPLSFTDTTIVKWNKAEDDIVSKRQILKNSRFTVEVKATGNIVDNRKEIIINGHKLRTGIELDTSVSATEFINFIAIDQQSCSLMTFGNKEYLLLNGYIEMCSGMACGVSFYLLYDPVIKKAMLLEQFRGDFIAGYDKKENSPVFINMKPNHEYSNEYQCYMTSGKVYRFTQAGKVKPVLDKADKQIEFTAYTRGLDFPLHVIKGNFVRSN